MVSDSAVPTELVLSVFGSTTLTIQRNPTCQQRTWSAPKLHWFAQSRASCKPTTAVRSVRWEGGVNARHLQDVDGVEWPITTANFAIWVRERRACTDSLPNKAIKLTLTLSE